jgi:hypothetical protein
MMRTLNRRGFLRGSLGCGAGIAIGIPMLEIFLSDNGDALASGGPLPLRFGTWFWGNGMTPERWNPERAGGDFDLPPELAPLEDLRDEWTVFSDFDVNLGSSGNEVHYSGYMGTLTGEVPAIGQISTRPTLDVRIADGIGEASRFRSLTMAATGNPRHSYSQRNQNAPTPAEPTALALYQRIFAEGFAMPGDGEWSPPLASVLQASALSVVAEERRQFEGLLGSADRHRLDEFFTSLRSVERQLQIQMQKPERRAACRVPPRPPERRVELRMEDIEENHLLMAEILALALACDQTRVFNMVFTSAASAAYIPGGSANHHVLTHTEPLDAALGYQVEANQYVLRSMRALAAFLDTLRGIEEGDGTLLDHCLVLAHSEHSAANNHDIRGIPVLVAGRANGRLRPGQHIRGEGTPVTRIGLTAQQVMGLEAEEFGSGPNLTSRPIDEIRAA